MTPFMAAFMPLVPDASSGPTRVVEPDVDALHELARHAHVVVLEDEDAAAQRLGAAVVEDGLDDALSGSVGRMGLAGEDELHRSVGVVDQRGECGRCR